MVAVAVTDNLNPDYNMNRSKGLLKGTVGIFSAVAALVIVPVMATADDVTYQANKLASGTQVSPSNQFGDEINLFGGSQAAITSFSFSYYVSPRFVSGAGKTMTLTLHQMDGPVVSGRNSPGTVISQVTLPVVRDPSGNSGVVLAFGTPLWVPSNLGWTITLAGLGPTEKVGLWAADTVVGSSLNDYWVNTGGSWGLATIAGGAIPGTFAATVLAVPEPSVSQLGLIGIAFLFGSRFLRRR